MTDDPGQKWNGRGDALKNEAVQRLAHPAERFVAAVAVHDHLGQE
jgi:hypothetical protein